MRHIECVRHILVASNYASYLNICDNCCTTFAEKKFYRCKSYGYLCNVFQDAIRGETNPRLLFFALDALDYSSLLHRPEFHRVLDTLLVNLFSTHNTPEDIFFCLRENNFLTGREGGVLVSPQLLTTALGTLERLSLLQREIPCETDLFYHLYRVRYLLLTMTVGADEV